MLWASVGGIFGSGLGGLLLLGLKGISRLYERFTNLEIQVAVVQADVRWIKAVLERWVDHNDAPSRS